MTGAALADSPWNDPTFTIPDRINEVEGMLNWHEKRMLYWLARRHYTGEGKICDLGAYLGGSTICFAMGLRDASRSGKLIYSYDRFVLGPFEQTVFRGELPPNNETLPIFTNNLRGYHDLLVVKAGDVASHRWDAGPIEILFVDLAKSAMTWDHVVREFFPHLIPGKSIVILQDYIWHASGAWHHVVMEKLRNHFDYVVDTDVNSAVFQYTRPFEFGVLSHAMWDTISADEKAELMEQAIQRMTTEKKRETLRAVQTTLLSIG